MPTSAPRFHKAHKSPITCNIIAPTALEPQALLSQRTESRRNANWSPRRHVRKTGNSSQVGGDRRLNCTSDTRSGASLTSPRWTIIAAKGPNRRQIDTFTLTFGCHSLRGGVCSLFQRVCGGSFPDPREKPGQIRENSLFGGTIFGNQRVASNTCISAEALCNREAFSCNR